MQMISSLSSLILLAATGTAAPTEIKTDTTWLASSGPYLVSESVIVSSGATLTIEAGTVVKFAKGAEMKIGDKTPGKLVVNGKAAAPVMFTSDSGDAASGYWKGITARFKGSSVTMQSAMITGGGNNEKSSPDSQRFALSIGPEIGCKLEKVTIQNCTRGIELDTEIEAVVKECTIKDCEKEAVSVAQEVAHVIDTSNVISGNGINAIVVGEVGDTQFLKSRVWSNTLLPYLVRGDLLVDGPSNGVSLTLGAGVTVLFDEYSSITIGWVHQADFIANGSPEKPILFKSFKGKWDGIYLGLTGPSTQFVNCRFIDGGAVSAMLIADENSKATVKQCRFENSETWGISITQGASVKLENNSFAGNKLGDIDR